MKKLILSALITTASSVFALSSNTQKTEIYPDYKSLKLDSPIGINPTDLIPYQPSKEDNIRHKAFCEKMGGFDVTKFGTTEVTKGTKDAVFCQITDNNKFEEFKNSHPKNLLFPNTLNFIHNKAGQGEFEVYSFSGKISYAHYYYPVARMNYSDIPQSLGYIDISVPSDNCSAANEQSIGGGTGTLTASVLCQASEPSGEGNYPTYAHGCLNGNNCILGQGALLEQ